MGHPRVRLPNPEVGKRRFMFDKSAKATDASVITASESTYIAPCEVGLGVFAGRHFEAGETILVFEGEIVGRDHPIHYSPQSGYLLQIAKEAYIYPVSPGYYVNHSCDPNAGIAGSDRLIAIRAIEEGEEIRFDYSTTMDEDLWTMDCRCGAARCRSLITDFKLLPERVQREYLRSGIVSDFIKECYSEGVL